MKDYSTADLQELEGIVLSHSALFAAIFAGLQARGIVDQAAVNQMIDMALVGVEVGEHDRQAAKRVARKILEGMAGTMGGPLERKPGR